VTAEGIIMTSNRKPYDEPSDVRAVDGDVVIEGPGDVDIIMTPKAAEKTAGELVRSAQSARGQKRQKLS
jgi:hypothetical protein